MHAWAVILAAGRGSRMGGDIPKQFLPFRGAPLFWASALALARVPSLRGLVFVFPPDDGAAEGERLVRELDAGGRLGLPFRFAAGGRERQDSTAAGLAALPPECEAVLVHDAARPLVSAALAGRVLDGLRAGYAAVVPGLALADTVKSVDAEGLVAHTPERSALRAVQTPQGFCVRPLRQALARAREEGLLATDDAALVERCGHAVLVVAGDEDNRKITGPADLRWLERREHEAGTHPPLFADGRQMPSHVPCSGLGYDVHRYGGSRPLVLGGVPIPGGLTVEAHSDGDVLLHALADALLGCLGGGDIGLLFPDSDPAFDNMASGALLAEVLEKTRAAGLIITHADLTLVAQTPRLAPYRAEIRAAVAGLMNLPERAVNVKATTEEGLGFTGEKKGIKALALVSALKPLSGGGL